MAYFRHGAQLKMDLEHEFFEAVGHSNYYKVQECLDKGINVNTYNELGLTALIEAAMSGDNKLLNMILKCPNIDLEMKSLEFGFTALHSAVRSEHYDTTKILLSFGANCNVLNRNNSTCLHFAVSTSNLVITHILLYYGANVDAIDTFQHTPLSLAVLDTRNYEIAKLLLSFDANPNLMRVNHIPLVYETILNTNGNFYVPFIRLLYKYGGDFNQKDNVGRMGMHYAAMTGYTALAAVLLDMGCSFMEKDKLDLLPIDIARRHSNKEMIQFLEKVMNSNDEIEMELDLDDFNTRHVLSSQRPLTILNKISQALWHKKK